MWGYVERMPGRQKPCPASDEMLFFGRAKCGAFGWLYQTQLDCPFDGRPAILDVEFSVDALGMGADRAQGDQEFTGDLRPRKLGFEQAENVKLTLA
jgi:hypothetical protein